MYVQMSKTKGQKGAMLANTFVTSKGKGTLIQRWAKANLSNTDFVHLAGNHWQMNLANEQVLLTNDTLQAFHVHASIYTNATPNYNEFHIKYDDGGNRRVYFFFTQNGNLNPVFDATKSTVNYPGLNIPDGEFAEMRSKAIELSRTIANQL